MRTLLKKWICVLLGIIAIIIPTHLLCHPSWIPKDQIQVQKEKWNFVVAGLRPSSTKREIRNFHVVVVQKRAKKCTKKRDARAKLLFAYKIYFLTFSLPSVSLDLLSLHQSTHGEKRDACLKVVVWLVANVAVAVAFAGCIQNRSSFETQTLSLLRVVFFRKCLIFLLIMCSKTHMILRCFDTVFQRPYRYFSISLKVVFPCPIAIKLSPVTGYGLKFVKMWF